MKTLLIWLVMVLILSVYPFENLALRSVYADKALHFVLYGITCTLMYVVFRGTGSLFFGRRALPLAVVLASGYGLVMEALQGLTTARDFSLGDAAANILGAVTAVGFILLMRRKT